MTPIRFSVCCALAALACQSAEAVSPGTTTVLTSSWAGPGVPPHPSNAGVLFYGTDLGFSYKHGNNLQLLFGDTIGVADEWHVCPIAAWSINPFCVDNWDDALGSVSLTDHPDPTVFATNPPLVKLLRETSGNQVWPMINEKPMDLFKTPVGGFSNGSREYAVFLMGKPVACTTNSECNGGNSAMICDTGLGWWQSAPWDDWGFTAGCGDSQSGCTPNTKNGVTTPATGFCVDSGSSIYKNTTLTGRMAGWAFKMRYGIRRTDDNRQYNTTEFKTNRFYNPAVTTVQSFVPANGGSYLNQNYNVATGSGTDRKVFVWGRPGFVGVGAVNRPAALYFGYMSIPTGTGTPTWSMQYYTGTNGSGIPQFDSNEANAVALTINSTPGQETKEVYDAVGQMSIVWVDQLHKWVMFYGGGATKVPKDNYAQCGVLEMLTGPDCTSVNLQNGAIRMRTADYPWGPWTNGVDVLVGGNPSVAPANQYAPGGILRHPNCTAPSCAPHQNIPVFVSGEYGYLYAPVIHQPWIATSGMGVDLIWSVSTWDPYRVVLLRTHLNP